MSLSGDIIVFNSTRQDLDFIKSSRVMLFINYSTWKQAFQNFTWGYAVITWLDNKQFQAARLPSCRFPELWEGWSYIHVSNFWKKSKCVLTGSRPFPQLFESFYTCVCPAYNSGPQSKTQSKVDDQHGIIFIYGIFQLE